MQQSRGKQFKGPCIMAKNGLKSRAGVDLNTKLHPCNQTGKHIDFQKKRKTGDTPFFFSLEQRNIRMCVSWSLCVVLCAHCMRFVHSPTTAYADTPLFCNLIMKPSDLTARRSRSTGSPFSVG